MTKKIYGTWNKRLAFILDGELFLIIGTDNGWVRKGHDTSLFEPYGPAEMNDPKYRKDVIGKVGGEYSGKYSSSLRAAR